MVRQNRGGISPARKCGPGSEYTGLRSVRWRSHRIGSRRTPSYLHGHSGISRTSSRHSDARVCQRENSTEGWSGADRVDVADDQLSIDRRMGRGRSGHVVTSAGYRLDDRGAQRHHPTHDGRRQFVAKRWPFARSVGRPPMGREIRASCAKTAPTFTGETIWPGL
jgi:hypothetical protein